MSTGPCRLTVTVRPARDADELDEAKRLRVRVFCDEQGVSREEELDEHDDTALHLVGLDESGLIATCRLRELGGGAVKLERMAVLGRLRGNGIGAVLIEHAERHAAEMGADELVLHAQTVAEGFYATNGFAAEGERFDEAGIEHVKMRKALRS